GLISFIFKKSLGLSNDFEFLSQLYTQPALRIEFQPSETVSLQMFFKFPGFEIKEQPAFLSLNMPRFFKTPFKDAYSRVLYDAIRGDRFLFMSDKEIIRSWEIVDPIMELFVKDIVPLRYYPSGSWGPSESNKLIENFGFRWESL
ncbi:MAG: hypothetical protein NZO16_07770, partial [Deltaproteobacteria bacterium]|nr:hypothetical protein [Deltaproteobacteria bacterium]